MKRKSNKNINPRNENWKEKIKGREKKRDGVYGDKYHQLLLSGQIAILLKVYQAHG